jgi:CrcB protein
MTLTHILAVAAGGAIGSVGRYWMAHQVNLSMGYGGLPWGTLSVNVIGSFLIGFLLIALQEWLHAADTWRLLLVVGVLGGFTTFSSFSWDTYALWAQGKVMLASVNVGVSLLSCLLGTALGVWLARTILPVSVAN